MLITWIIFSIVVAVIASSRKLGFAKGLIISLLLSPIVGIIFALISDKINKSEDMTVVERLQALENMKNNGSITEEEYIKIKNSLEETVSRLKQKYANRSKFQGNRQSHITTLSGEKIYTNNPN